MKTLKTINTAFAITLLVSAVSASALPTRIDFVKAPFIWVAEKAGEAKGYVASTTVVQDYLKPAKEYVVGANKEDDKGLPGVKTAYNFLVRDYGRYTAAVTVAAGLGLAGYSYFTAEEEADKTEGDSVNQPSTPVDQVDEPVAPTPVVEPVVAPEPVVSKPKRSLKKSPKATTKRKVSGCRSGRCGARR